MTGAITSFKDRYLSAMKAKATAIEKGKQTLHMGVGFIAAGGTGLALGALDEAKGESKKDDNGIRQHYLGVVPTAAAVSAAGLLLALAMPHKSMEMQAALGIAEGAGGAQGYVMGRRGWIRHKQSAKK